jgi:hypothetical protein
MRESPAAKQHRRQRRDAEILKSGGSLVSTIHAADEGWFAERKITAHNVAPNSNPLSSPQGLTELARMLGDGKITARIRSVVELDGAEPVLLDCFQHFGGGQPGVKEIMTCQLCVTANLDCNVRFGSKADMKAHSRHVRFAPNTGH